MHWPVDVNQGKLQNAYTSGLKPKFVLHTGRPKFSLMEFYHNCVYKVAFESKQNLADVNFHNFFSH